MAVKFSDPTETLLALQRALESFRTSSWLNTGPSGTGAYPPVNVFRKNDDFVVVVELPGVEKTTLDIQVKGRTIRIAGVKSVEYPENSSLHRRERLKGRFDRSINIPVEIDADKTKAEYHDGVLALFLPRAEQDKPKTIKLS